VRPEAVSQLRSRAPRVQVRASVCVRDGGTRSGLLPFS
jgi:hypothetical protein